MAAIPFFTDVCQVSVANPNYNGSGVTVLLSAGTLTGKRLSVIKCQGVGNPLNGNVRLFYSPDNGVTKFFIAERVVDPVLPPLTGLSFFGNIALPENMVLNVGQNIYASSSNGVVVNLFATGILVA
jgi:hypothetical protein